MSEIRGITCNAGCGQHLTKIFGPGEDRPTKARLEQAARRRGWQAPDKLGRHWCPAHRRPDGVPKNKRSAT